MLVIYLAGYFYGGWTGLFAALIFGGIKFLLRNVNDSDNVAAELFDYILGYGLIGFGGFLFRKKERSESEENDQRPQSGESLRQEKGRLQAGYILAVLLRYIESVWNCSYFYHETVQYSLVYSSYIVVELLVTLLILCIPQVRETIAYLKYVATNKYEEDLDTF